MQKTGNGATNICVNNLLQLTRGEIPLDQLRGIRADLTDRPATIAAPLFAAAARWVVDNYEPRAAFDALELTAGDASGNFNQSASYH